MDCVLKSNIAIACSLQIHNWAAESSNESNISPTTSEQCSGCSKFSSAIYSDTGSVSHYKLL